MRVISKFEVACPACRVSYPPGQKRCIHCGGKTEKSVVDVPDAPPEFTDAMGRAEREPEPPAMLAGDGHEFVFLPRDTSEEDAEETRGGILRRLGGLVWVALFVVLTVIRMCAEE